LHGYPLQSSEPPILDQPSSAVEPSAPTISEGSSNYSPESESDISPAPAVDKNNTCSNNKNLPTGDIAYPKAFNNPIDVHYHQKSPSSLDLGNQAAGADKVAKALVFAPVETASRSYPSPATKLGTTTVSYSDEEYPPVNLDSVAGIDNLSPSPNPYPNPIPDLIPQLPQIPNPAVTEQYNMAEADKVILPDPFSGGPHEDASEFWRILVEINHVFNLQRNQ